MMIDYIVKTLHKGDTVVIDGLGDFTVRLRHAFSDGKIFHPPFNEVVFTQNQDPANSFSLADTVSRERKCLFTEANEEISAWKEELLTALRNNKSVSFEGFGTFMLDKKGRIAFQCDFIPELNARFETFEPIDVKRLLNTSEEIAETEEGGSEPDKHASDSQQPEPAVAEESIPVSEDTIPVAPIPEETPCQEQPSTEAGTPPEETGIERPQENGPAVIEEESEGSDAEEQTQAQGQEIAEHSDAIADKPTESAENASVANVQSSGEPDDESDEDETAADDDIVDTDSADDGQGTDATTPHGGDRKHRMAWLWVLLLLAVVLLTLGFVFKDRLLEQWSRFRQDSTNTEQTDTVSESALPLAADTSFVLEPDTTEVEGYEETSPEKQEPEVVKKTVDGKYDYIRFEEGRYYVIAGSFYTEKDVENHIRHKGLDKYSPVIVMQDGVKNLRVCIGVFDTEDEAESFAKNVNQQYWVLK